MKKIIYILCIVLAITNIAYGKRVISLAPSITQAIYELNQQTQLVGCTQYCKTEAEDSITIVADAIQANIERIVLLKPDIVIASQLTHPKIIKTLESMGITCFHWFQPIDFNDVCEQFLQIAVYLNCEQEANRIISDCKERLFRLQERSYPLDPLKMFIQVGANPLYTILDNTFTADYIKQMHGVNISSKLKHGQISAEHVLLQNPDIIIITTMGGLGQKEVEYWQGFSTLKAAQNQKIFLMDEYEICCPTPIRMITTLEKLYSKIYE